MLIRFINTYEPVTSFYRDLLPYLVENEVDVEVFISKTKYTEAKGDFEKSLQNDKVKIEYIKTPDILKTTNIKLATMVSYAVGVMWRSLFKHPSDINFFLSQPPMFAIWGYFLKVIKKQPYCCLIMDLYPDVLIMNGVPFLWKPITKVLTKLSRFTINHADKVIVIGRCMRDHLNNTGVKRNDIKIITNWGNEKAMHPVKRDDNSLRKELKLTKDFIVLYSGNMGISHFFDDILEVAKRLRYLKDMKFIFIGNGVRHKEILSAIKKFDLYNLILLPYQPVENLSMSLSLGDIHFISLRNKFEGIVVPSKAYGAIEVGRPIIYQGASNGEIAQMIIEKGIGSIVEPYNPDELENIILSYYSNPDKVDKTGKVSYELSLTHYNKNKMLSKYYDSICN